MLSFHLLIGALISFLTGAGLVLFILRRHVRNTVRLLQIMHELENAQKMLEHNREAFRELIWEANHKYINPQLQRIEAFIDLMNIDKENIKDHLNNLKEAARNYRKSVYEFMKKYEKFQ